MQRIQEINIDKVLLSNLLALFLMCYWLQLMHLIVKESPGSSLVKSPLPPSPNLEYSSVFLCSFFFSCDSDILKREQAVSVIAFPLHLGLGNVFLCNSTQTLHLWQDNPKGCYVCLRRIRPYTIATHRLGWQRQSDV